MITVGRTAFVTIAGLLAASAFVAAEGYRIEVIGPEDRSTTLPVDINNSGVIAMSIPGSNSGDVPGVAITINGSGQVTPLQGLGGRATQVSAINNHGVSVGWGFPVGPPETRREPLIWDVAGSYELFAEGSLFTARSINDAGVVVGQSNGAAFTYTSEDGLVDLSPIVGPSGSARDVSNSGEIVGTAILDSSQLSRSAFLLRDGELVDMGVTFGSANAINEVGQVVGEAFDGTRFRAFLYDTNDGVSYLDDLDAITSPRDINLSGTVVGLIDDGSGLRDAFIYDDEGGFRLLASLLPLDSGWDRLFGANAINDRGQIVGRGLKDGMAVSFLMTPIPEPSAFAAMFLALVSLISWMPRHYVLPTC